MCGMCNVCGMCVVWLVLEVKVVCSLVSVGSESCVLLSDPVFKTNAAVPYSYFQCGCCRSNNPDMLLWTTSVAIIILLPGTIL